MELSQFNYHLPEELIAQEPAAERDGARMLVLHRKEGRWEDRMFRDLPEFLGPGDLLVFNNSRVFPSRLLGHREGFTGRVEVFLVRPLHDDDRVWRALVRPGRKIRSGETIVFGPDFKATVLGRGEFGERTVRLDGDDVWDAIHKYGHMPLPPYIQRPDTPSDAERYQTIFAQQRGSVAAPTAGLHFTPRVLDAVRARGAATATVTLHVGLGTFQPLHSPVVEENHLHREHFAVNPDAAAAIREAARVIAVGTTSVRTIESFMRGSNAGETDIFIYPGYEFQRVNAMVTNFHLPQSSLLLLVCAFGGTDFVLSAYEHAVKERYRFFSYGDCMLVL